MSEALNGNNLSGCPLWMAHVAQESGLCSRDRADAGLGDWRQHGRFHGYQRGLAAAASLREAGGMSAGVGDADFRGFSADGVVLSRLCGYAKQPGVRATRRLLADHNDIVAAEWRGAGDGRGGEHGILRDPWRASGSGTDVRTIGGNGTKDCIRSAFLWRMAETLRRRSGHRREDSD